MPFHATDLAASKTQACPYLGVQNDPDTFSGYPAEWNLCYRAKPVAAIGLGQQRKVCLSAVFSQCPVFLSERSAPLPKHLRGARANGRMKWILLGTLILLSALGLWLTWLAHADKAVPMLGILAVPITGPQESTRATTLVASATPFSLGAGLPRPIPVGSPVAPEASATSPPASVRSCGYELETEVEWQGRLLMLHTVRRGESIAILESNYRTSLQALQAVNYFLPSPLWANLVIVLPVGNLSGEGLPVVEPYLVPHPGLSLASLSGQHGLTPEELLEANALDPDCQMIAG